ncbi:MAG: 2-hydroxyacyl-CoA dehydratase [Negativicutes bacterium]|nr:2-hydroxyacyl-CoA dehydratase [Negativicutes bacterium]
MSRIGITTTVPVEIILAAGHTPVDLNNIFISDPAATRLVEEAEEAGYPRNVCGWIKGLYAVVVKREGIDKVIAVTQGDCSNTHALMETFQLAGVESIPFAYPYERDYEALKQQMERLLAALGTYWEQVAAVKRRLDGVRAKVAEIDRLTWQENKVSGWHNHLYQVSCSDFNGDVDAFEADVDSFLVRAQAATPAAGGVRLGFIGVPPIFTDIYTYVETQGARIVFNEVQRQFAMPGAVPDIIEQYRAYTYPYGVFGRIADIQPQIAERRLDGIIHYVQSFCFRQIEDMVFRQKLDVPILTIEGDKPGKLDARTRLRIDSFIEMLR